MFLGNNRSHTSYMKSPSTRSHPTTIPLVVEGRRKAILITSTPYTAKLSWTKLQDNIVAANS